ncbi:Rhs element Vgr protein [Thiothrix caldifontis]|uniref:Rhs element Vgr protein n=1 Tax=Thiothrix caldifontis TaxID=525918 RepID=A0A1H4BJ53_9GAMM|nr:type VI secretion system tip protein VgrG [Thiothrix caldifontis]SEA48150.1 Rhs element Vgr protein [Thiothrix caldifontis]
MSDPSSIPTPATPDVCTAVLRIDGAEISGEFHVLSVTVSRELNRIPSAEFQLRDGEASQATFAASNTNHFIPGKAVEIQLGYRSQNTPVFKGIIVKHSIKIRKNGSLLQVECRDAAFSMTHGTHSRFHLDKKDNEIMEELISAHALTAEVASTRPALKSVVQYDASDWDFMLCRAEANGMVVMVEDGKIRISPPATGTEPVVAIRYGSTILELDAEMDARWQSKGMKASAWNASTQEMLETEAQEPQLPASGNLSPAQLAQAAKTDIHTLHHGGKLDQAELQAWADARLLQERLARIRGRAKFQGFAGIMPGHIIEITGIGERFAGKCYVSGVRHHLANGNWETDVQFGLNPERFASTYNLRPLPAAGLLPGVSGLHTGVVTALENDPEGEERIQVRLPLVSAEAEGLWARLATLNAGEGHGMFFRPDIGDEVVVGFLHDDPRYPVILGMCHSSAKPTPEPAKDDNFRKGYRSREKLQLSFDDEHKVIKLETPTGNTLTLSEQDTAILIADQNGNKLTLNADGITLESAKDLILKASGDVKLEAMNVDIKTNAAFKVTATASAEVSGASTTVKGSATTVIQGGIVQIN